MSIAKMIADLKVEPEPVAEIEDKFVVVGEDSIGIRIYRPVLNKKLPILYYIHGGAWVAGDLETHKNICSYFSNKLQVIVVAVDYRRPPENKFPIPFNDCYNVFKWISTHTKQLGGNKKLLIMGESAGGQLVASVCATNSKEKKPVNILAQVLVIPALDLSKNSVTYANYKGAVDWYLNPSDSTSDLRISPLLSKDFSKTPPTIIVVGENDPIRNDAEAYNKKLEEIGVTSFLSVQPNVGHFAANWCAATGKALPAMEFIVGKVKELYLK